MIHGFPHTIIALCFTLLGNAVLVRNVDAQANVDSQAAAGQGKQKSQGGQKGGGKGGQKGGKGKENLLQISGTVRQVSAQAIVVESDNGARYLIGATPESQITLRGEASEELLKTGATVEFEMDFDRLGNPIGSIDAITFVEISSLNPMGLFPRTVAGLKNAADENGQTSFLARGKISSLRNGMLVVQTGGRPLLAKLEDDVDYAARFDRWVLAAVGDSVTGAVELLPQPNVGLTNVLASQLTIDAAEPIGPIKPKRADSKTKPAADRKSAAEGSQPSSNSN